MYTKHALFIIWWFYILAWSERSTYIAKPNLEVLPFNYLFYSLLSSFICLFMASI